MTILSGCRKSFIAEPSLKNSGLDEVVQQIDLQHILLETDSPWLTPAPFRGQRNDSSHIPLIAEKIAEIKNISIEEVAEVTTANALKIFRI